MAKLAVLSHIFYNEGDSTDNFVQFEHKSRRRTYDDSRIEYTGATMDKSGPAITRG
jgi:hypothetical protein